MAKSFSTQVDDWIRQSQGRIDAVVKQSAQDVVAAAQTPRAKGGNMPVDTGFLRNSIRASTSGMPSSSSDAVATGILRWKPESQLLYIGWAANYAPYMERRYAFMRLAAQQWQEIVNRNATKLKGMRDARTDT